MAVPENIEELAHLVRTAIHGREVRESLASSMEATADVADWSRHVAQQIIDGDFEEGALQTEIERKLIELEIRYAPNLTSLEEEMEKARGDSADLSQRLLSVDEKIENNMEVVSDYNLFPQSPKPEKKGLKTSSPKVIHKTTDDELQIIQRTNKGYAHYTFAKNIGASQVDRDYGVNHELIRIIKARQIQDAYVYLDMKNHLTGSLPVQNEEGNFNTPESLLFWLPNPDHDRNISSKGTAGMATYTLEGGAEASYNIQSTNSGKGNMLFYCSAGSSNEVQILVNDVVIKTFNPRTFLVGGNQSMTIIEFDIPIKSTGTDSFKLTVKNVGSGNVYPCAINFYKLKDYTGEVVDNYKAFGSSKTGWIENNGASDYAIYDEDEQKWFGSYHGGEISEYDRIVWNSNNNYEKNDYSLSHAPFDTIPTGEWRVQKYFSIYQQTDLASGKAKMVSEFDFNTDGSIEMDFGYYQGTVNLSTFYTALTCTSTPFSYIFHPAFLNFGNTPSNEIFPIDTTEGKVSQVNPVDVLQLDIRFTKFNSRHDIRGVAIADNNAYRKLYYGPIYGSKGFVLSSLSFSKGLDFIVR